MTDNQTPEYDAEWARGAFAPFVKQARAVMEQMGRPVETSNEAILERLRRLEDERDIERVFRRYHAFYDAADIDGLMSVYTEDAIQINARGTYKGHAELRESYKWLVQNQKSIIHYGTNVVVELDDVDRDRGLLTAFWNAMNTGYNGVTTLSGGTYLNRMRRVDGQWKISEQRISFHFLNRLEPILRDLRGKPDSWLPLRTLDLIEERYLNV